MIDLKYPDVVNGFKYGYSRLSDRDVFYPCMRDPFSGSLKECKRRVMEALCQSLACVKPPVAVLYSGGVDSTMILLTAMNCYFLKDIWAVSLGYEGRDSAYDESETAKGICRRLGIQSVSVYSDDGLPKRVLAGLTEKTCSQWFYSSSLIPTFAAYDSAKGVGAILTGDGGDELFYGYDRYLLWNWIRELSPETRRKIAGQLPKGKSRRWRKFLAGLENGYRGLVSLWGDDDLRELFDIRFLPYNDLLSDMMEPYSPHSAMLFDIRTELLGVESLKVRTASLMTGCKVTMPFMENIPFFVSIPFRFKYRRRIRKWILRELIREMLPAYDFIGPGKRKRGFAAPISRWMADRPVEDFMIGDGLLNNAKIREIWEKNRAGIDYGEQLWSVMVWRELVKKNLVEVK